MSTIEEDKLRKLVSTYKSNLESELGVKVESRPKMTSVEYKQFKKEFMPKHLSIYEKLCNISEHILPIGVDKKQTEEMNEYIRISHLGITPKGAVSFSFLGPLLLMGIGMFFSFLILQSTFFLVFFGIVGLGLIKPLGSVPKFSANSWRMKASNQMVLCIFYIVTYMRHTPNLENAIVFAADHLSPPLALDMKKLIWDVETEEHPTLKDGLDEYLQTWQKWNLEFIEAFRLVESSLYEGNEGRRLNSLDKALEVILDETYEKMLHYAHGLQGPITMLHMLGVIMPILGLVILPLVVAFMDGVRWYHIAVFYNFLFPGIVFYMGRNILSSRPTGYGDTDVTETNPELRKYKNVIFRIGKSEMQMSPLFFSVIVFVVLLIIGFSPLALNLIGFPDLGLGGDDDLSSCKKKFCLLEYRYNNDTGKFSGPFGLGAAVLSLAVPLSFAFLFGLYYRLRSKNVIKIRKRAKQLELEFASALFQLGNRLGDNVPVEIAVEKVSSIMEGTISGNFFRLVSMNQRQLGMGIEQSIFDPQKGALVQFPSNLIESSMKVLTQSIKKGPRIAAQALTNVSRYIKEIHKVNERLKDILADIISSMQSQIKFLAPAIAGVVIGITSMITTILGKLGRQLEDVTSSVGPDGAAGSPTGMLAIFGDSLPTFQFQIIVGLYVVQIIYTLTILANGVENGADKLSEQFELGRNLINGTILYTIIALVVMLMFNLIAARILTSTLV